MYDLLIKLMFVAALAQLEMSLPRTISCQSRQCLKQVEKRSRDILRIDWKLISMFPEEAERFR